MVKSTGLYPRVRVDTSATAAVGQAGGVLLTRTVTATGLDRLLSLALARWRKPLAVHDPGKILLVMVRLANLVCRKIGIGLRTDPDMILVTSTEAGILGLSDITLAELEIAMEDHVTNAEI